MECFDALSRRREKESYPDREHSASAGRDVSNGRNDLADRSRGSRDSRIRSADKREIGRRHSRQAAIIEHGGRRPCPATFILDNIFYR
jgi:hypothetical protein